MSIKSFLRDQGLVEDTPGATATPPPRSQPTARSAAPAPAHAAENSAAALDDRAVKVLTDKLEKSQVPGYTDFVNVNGDLSGDIDDPNKRARAALKSVARTLKIPPEQILNSVDDRLKILKEARQHLGASMDSLLTSQVGEKDAAIAALGVKIRQMEADLASRRQEQSVATAEREQISNDLHAKKALLVAAADHLARQLTADRDLISGNIGK